MDVNAVIREIEEQRNFMAARCAKMAGDLAASEQRIASLEDEIVKLRTETGVVDLEDSDGNPTTAAMAQEDRSRAPLERMAPMDAFRELARRNGMDPNK